MDGLFLACLMGICGMPMSPSPEPLAGVALTTSTAAPSIAAESQPAPPSVAALGATVAIAPPVPAIEQPVERPVPTASEPEVRPAAPDGVSTASTTKSSRASIGEVVRRHAAAVRNCYEKGLADDPTLKGTLEVAWRIQVDGKVSGVSIVGGTGRNPVAEHCLMAEIPRWEFPPSAEPTVVGTFPFVFDATTLVRHSAPAIAKPGPTATTRSRP
jgi:hypothetical protein